MHKRPNYHVGTSPRYFQLPFVCRAFLSYFETRAPSVCRKKHWLFTMALTPIELRDATSSSHSLIDHRQSLLSTSQRHENPMDSSAIVLQHRSRFSRWCAPWMPEIICWIISLCFTAGLIIALVVFEGHALPDLPLGINPNAIIQVLATFSEFFMMIPVTSALGQMKWLRALQVRPADDFCAMDDASRGPWGSFLLIVRGKGG